MEKPVVVAVEQPKPVEPPVVAVEKPVEIAALPKPIAKPVPKKIVEIVEAKPAEQPKPIEPPVVAVEQPAPKKTVDLVAPKLVELPAAKPVMAAVPAEAAPSLPPTTTPEIVLMAPVRAPDAPDVPRPATPKARYEAPICVATAVAPAPAAQPEPAEPEIPAVTPEQPASADQQQVVPAVSANAATVPVASQLGAKPDRSWQEGVVFPLKDQAVPEASHILYRREGTVCYPICYLRSSRIDLSQWELREVRLYGDQVEVPGWSRPVIDVRGMQLKVAE